MGHIVKKRGFCAVRILCGMNRLFKRLIDFLILCPVGQIQDIFFLTLDITAEYCHPEPAFFTGFLMNIFSVPLTLLPRQNIRKLFQYVDRFVRPDAPLYLVDIIDNLLF